MRRMILTSLALLPVMAHAQASTSSPAVNVAEMTQPIAASELAVKAGSKAALPVTSMEGMNSSSPAAVREFVRTRMVESFADEALMRAGTLEYAMMGSAPTEASAPKVTRAVEVSLSNAELAEQPAVNTVVVHAIVDANGVPRNVAVTQSGGSLIDRKAVEAVSQYRFVPATVDNKATWSTVSIAIKIEKP